MARQSSKNRGWTAMVVCSLAVVLGIVAIASTSTSVSAGDRPEVPMSDISGPISAQTVSSNEQPQHVASLSVVMKDWRLSRKPTATRQ